MTIANAAPAPVTIHQCCPTQSKMAISSLIHEQS
jgi:hypothetical protein